MRWRQRSGSLLLRTERVQANRLYAYDLKGGKNRLVYDLSQDKLKDIALGEVHDWNFKSDDGTTIQVVITYRLISIRIRNSDDRLLLWRYFPDEPCAGDALFHAYVRRSRIRGLHLESEWNNGLRTGIRRPPCERMGPEDRR